MSSNGRIDRAVALAGKPKTKAVRIGAMQIKIADRPIVVKASHELSFTRGADVDPADANLMIYDPTIKAWRAVLTPPGTSWELVAKQQGPTIWTPERKPT